MKTIDIRTTQNVTIEYDLASVGDRIFAFLIDALILTVGHVIFASFLTAIFSFAIYDDDWLAMFIWSFLPFFELLLYHFLLEYFGKGQSLGKRSMGIKVIRIDGQEPTAGDYALRSVFLIVDAVFCFGVIAVMLISSSDKHQRLGDMTAHTTVIKVRQNLRFILADILKINTLDDYEPQYPAVRNLSEQDMLLIKSAINRHQTYRNAAHSQVIHELVKKLMEKLDIREQPRNRIEFLKTLIRDYIVLTR